MEVPMTVIHCAACGMPFAMTNDRIERLRECHNTFFCPAGHPMAYDQETKAERLSRELKALKAENERRDAAERIKRLEAEEKRQKALAKKAQAAKAKGRKK